MNVTGVLIIIEGGDGVGTTTQSALLYEYLQRKYSQFKFVLTAEPSQGPIGQLLRSILRRETTVHLDSRAIAALFFADRVDHYATVIQPAVNAGSWVISDRGYQSTLVYQALGIDSAQPADVDREAHWVMQLHSRLSCIPTYSFILDVPAEIAAERRAVRGQSEELYDGAEQQRRILQAYKHVPAWDWVSRVIQCGNDSVEKVHRELVRRIEALASEIGLPRNV
jgi:dTMP kinase